MRHRASAPKSDSGTPERQHRLADALALAARIVAKVVGGASLNAVLASLREPRAPLRAAAQDFSYNTLRAYGRVDVLADRLTDGRVTDTALRALLMVSLAELIARPQAGHAVVHQAVEAAAKLGLARASGLVNAVLRRYLRESDALLGELRRTEEGVYCHPRWWIERVRREYPDRWQSVLLAANAHPPMTLRVNVRRTTVEQYLALLAEQGIAARRLRGEAIMLERPVRVEWLPRFGDGWVSVQDLGAQYAAHLLDVLPGQRVLDACAAPGGKAAHILEGVDCDLTAVDVSPERTQRVSETLARLGLTARVDAADSLEPETFSGGVRYDRILLDAPCTASGVVRRHPDIRWLRREADIATFALLQERLLDALWRVLAPDGKLLYVTCSVFPEENRLQIERFLARHPDAGLEDADPDIPGIDRGQLLPSPENDGFYYALLQKGRQIHR